MGNKKLLIAALFFLILALGAGLRFYHLSSVPVALNGDEAAFGYNAFSIIKTLKDEHGVFLPLIFKSFGDYKPPVFVYLLAPITGIFGLSELAVRMPIAAVSVGVIWLTYLIAKKLFSSDLTALTAALFVAISPWAINFSRAGWEASLALFFTTLAIYLFLLGLENKKWIIGSVFFYMAAFYTYHAEKLAVPLLMVLGYSIFRNKINLSIKRLLLMLSVIFVLAVPALIGITNASGQSRAKGSLVIDYLAFSTKSFTDIVSKVFAYLSPAEVFVNGDPVGRHGAVDVGVLYPVDFIFLICAIYCFIRKQKNNFDIFLMVWLIVGLLPAMITKDRLHAIRALLAMPPVYIFDAWGLCQLALNLKKKSRLLSLVSVSALILILGISFFRFAESYFVYTPIERAEWWQYGYKQVVLTVHQEQDRFNRIVVDVPPIYGNPYIFFLFYQQYDPNLYNRTVSRKDNPKYKVSEVYSFGKYQFRQIDWREDRGQRKVLFVGTDESIPKNDITDAAKFRLIKEIKMPGGKTVFRIVETL